MFTALKERSIFFSIFLFILFLLFSCAPFHHNEKADFYRANPTSLFFAALQHSLELKSFAGNAQIAVESPQGNFNGIAQVYYQQPDSILVQIRAGFGLPVGNLLVIGDQIWLHDVRDHVLYRGKGADLSISDIVGVKLRVGNLLEATLGLPKPPEIKPTEFSTESQLRFTFEGDNIRFTLSTGDQKREYLANPARAVFLQYAIIQPADEDTVLCVFKQFRRLKQVYMPQHIQISHLQKHERLSLFYTDTQVNKKLPGNRFRLKVSEDVEIINLTREGYEN